MARRRLLTQHLVAAAGCGLLKVVQKPANIVA